jgi:catechol 2,3-dioxygenase-like lactoylglutathione lyase family enzyme
MRTAVCLIVIAILCIATQKQPCTSTIKQMKLNAGIITANLAATKTFYTSVLNFKVLFENEWYILLSTADGNEQLSFLKPNMPQQAPIFQPAFNGQGVYLTIEVEDADAIYKMIKEKAIPIEVELRDEPWGDRHFAIKDPNGIGIDIVKYTAPVS